MTIISIGNDLTRIERLGDVIERRGQSLLDRLFTPREQAYCESRKERITHYAGRFAAKEATMKVLGTGWAKGVRWVDLEVTREPGEAPRMVLHGESALIAERMGSRKLHISITHDAGLAMAVALAEGGR